jgi:hypothetical protein
LRLGLCLASDFRSHELIARSLWLCIQRGVFEPRRLAKGREGRKGSSEGVGILARRRGGMENESVWSRVVRSLSCLSRSCQWAKTPHRSRHERNRIGNGL